MGRLLVPMLMLVMLFLSYRKDYYDCNHDYKYDCAHDYNYDHGCNYAGVMFKLTVVLEVMIMCMCMVMLLRMFMNMCMNMLIACSCARSGS
jgi:hypothetical protein